MVKLGIHKAFPKAVTFLMFNVFLFITMHEVSMTLAGIIFRYVFQNSVCWLQLIPALPQQIDSLITINKLYSGRLVLLRIINYNFSGFTFGFYNFWIKLKHFFTSWVKFSITVLATRIQRVKVCKVTNVEFLRRKNYIINKVFEK